MPDLEERRTSIAPPPNGNLEELQALLLKKERERLERLEAELNQLNDHIKNKVIDVSAVAGVLPEAIYQRAKQDQHLEKSLAPIIGKVFVRAVNSFRQLIVDAISPVIMPAIRKAMETSMQGMARSINQMLDRSGLSWRMLTWRWEAWRTGRSFGDVVLSHTSRYDVERVFLYFRENSVHLADVHRPGVPPFEVGKEDLVSGMFSAILTAVQKFAQDEFQASEQVSAKTFETDDNKQVLIEYGAKAILVAVVRGIPSQSLRLALQDAVDSIHMELSEALQNFRGDKQPFVAARPYLESCLLHEESDAQSKTGSAHGFLSPALVVILVLLPSALGWWGVASYLDQQREADEQRRWAHFLEAARGKPGIQITHTQPADGKTIVYGLRDPISDDPHKIAQEVGLLPEAINFQLEPYQSLAPELVKRRDRGRLDQLVRDIQAHKFDFEAGGASLAVESGPALQDLRQVLRESDVLAQQLGNRIQVAIHGHTSEDGSVEINRRLALARAQGVLSTFNAERFQTIAFEAVAEPAVPPVIGEPQGSKIERARRVSFHVTVYDSGSTGARL